MILAPKNPDLEAVILSRGEESGEAEGVLRLHPIKPCPKIKGAYDF